MPAEVEAVLLELRRTRPYWGPRRLVFELAKRKVSPLPSEWAAYRALRRAAMIDPADRDRRLCKWKSYRGHGCEPPEHKMALGGYSQGAGVIDLSADSMPRPDG
jgi:hypothetical protein